MFVFQLATLCLAAGDVEEGIRTSFGRNLNRVWHFESSSSISGGSKRSHCPICDSKGAAAAADAAFPLREMANVAASWCGEY